MKGQMASKGAGNASPCDGRLGCSASQNESRAELATHRRLVFVPGPVWLCGDL